MGGPFRFTRMLGEKGSLITHISIITPMNAWEGSIGVRGLRVDYQDLRVVEYV